MIIGAHVDEVDRYGNTVTHVAAQYGHDAFINTLLLHKVCVVLVLLTGEDNSLVFVGTGRYTWLWWFIACARRCSVWQTGLL